MDMQNRFLESNPICVTRFRLVLVSLFCIVYNYAPQNPFIFLVTTFFLKEVELPRQRLLFKPRLGFIDMNSPGKSCATINYYVTAHIHRKIPLELIEA